MTHLADNASVPLPGLPVPDSAIPQLTAVVAGAARRYGGGSPEWASAVITTHEQALTSATPGSRVPGREQAVVYLVTMKGQFTAVKASPVSGWHPSGCYLSLVLDVHTMRCADLGLALSPPPVDPASFGPVTYLDTGSMALSPEPPR
jgi:hypothetical protein